MNKTHIPNGDVFSLIKTVTRSIVFGGKDVSKLMFTAKINESFESFAVKCNTTTIAMIRSSDQFLGFTPIFLSESLTGFLLAIFRDCDGNKNVYAISSQSDQDYEPKPILSIRHDEEAETKVTLDQNEYELHYSPFTRCLFITTLGRAISEEGATRIIYLRHQPFCGVMQGPQCRVFNIPGLLLHDIKEDAPSTIAFCPDDPSYGTASRFVFSGVKLLNFIVGASKNGQVIARFQAPDGKLIIGYFEHIEKDEVPVGVPQFKMVLAVRGTGERIRSAKLWIDPTTNRLMTQVPRFMSNMMLMRESVTEWEYVDEEQQWKMKEEV